MSNNERQYYGWNNRWKDKPHSTFKSTTQQNNINSECDVQANTPIYLDQHLLRLKNSIRMFTEATRLPSFNNNRFHNAFNNSLELFCCFTFRSVFARRSMVNTYVQCSIGTCVLWLHMESFKTTHKITCWELWNWIFVDVNNKIIQTTVAAL